MAWPQTRTRRIGWACIIAGLVIGAVLVVSLWKTVTICIGDRTLLGVEAGASTYLHAAKGETIVSPRSSTRTIAIESTHSDLIWRFHSSTSDRGSAFVAPFWPVMALLLITGTGLLWRTRQIAGPWCRVRTYFRSPIGCALILVAIGLAVEMRMSSGYVHGILLGHSYGLVCESSVIAIKSLNPSSGTLSASGAGVPPMTFAEVARMTGRQQHGPFFFVKAQDLQMFGSFFGIQHVSLTPLYPLVLLALVTGVILVIRAQRTLPGHCRKCRYNLTGLPPNSPCPECGKPPSPKEA